MIREVTGHRSSVSHIYEHPKIKQQKDVSSVFMSSNDKKNHPVTLTDQRTVGVNNGSISNTPQNLIVYFHSAQQEQQVVKGDAEPRDQ